MLTKFNVLYFNIITEKNESDNDSISIGPTIPKNPQYENIKLALIPGSFKPPKKEHMKMILQYCDIADIVLVFISNVSSETISNRVLSKSNLQPVAKLITNIQELNLKNNDIDNICNEIINASETITYNILIELLNKLTEQFNMYRNVYDSYINEIEHIKEILDNNLFKSIKKINNYEITPDVSKRLFEEYIKENGLQNKVKVFISKNPSPMIDIVSFVNNNCKNCTIYLGFNKTINDNSQWDSFLKMFGQNPTNEIVPYTINTKYNNKG